MTAEKYRKIASDLEVLLNSGSISCRLPTQRQLMQQYQVSSRTVHKAFQLLKQRKLIQTSPRGSMADRPVKVRRCFVFAGGEPQQDDALLLRLQQLSAGEGYEYVPTVLNAGQAVDFRQLGCCRSDVGIFVYSSFRSCFLPELEACQMPIAVANRVPPDIPVNWADWNHLEIFDNIIGELFARGAREIGFFFSSSADSADNSAMIAEDFIRAKHSYSLYNKVLDSFPIELYGNAQAYADFLHKLKKQPDALVIFGNHQYNVLAGELQKRNMEKLSQKLFCWGVQQPTEPSDDNSVGFYSDSCYRQLAEKLWKLIKYAAAHPGASPRGLKQHCVVKYRNKFRKIRKILSEQ